MTAQWGVIEALSRFTRLRNIKLPHLSALSMSVDSISGNTINWSRPDPNELKARDIQFYFASLIMDEVPCLNYVCAPYLDLSGDWNAEQEEWEFFRRVAGNQQRVEYRSVKRK
jgi:hypothetical protein